MNKKSIITILLALVAFAACRPSAQKAAADAVESIDSTETVISTKAVPSVDTLPAFSTTASSARASQDTVSMFWKIQDIMSYSCVFFGAG